MQTGKRVCCYTLREIKKEDHIKSWKMPKVNGEWEFIYSLSGLEV